MVDLEAAVRYPTRKDGWTATIAAGGSILLGSQGIGLLGTLLSLSLLVFAPVLQPLVALAVVVFSLPVVGYTVDVLRSTLDGEDAPPRFENVRSRLKDGLAAVAIALVYLIPFVILVGGSLLVAWIISTAADDAALLVVLGPLFAVPLGGIYTVLMAYLLPISVAIYAADGLTATTNPTRYRSIAVDRAYAGRWLVALVAWFIGALMAQWLAVFVIGFFLYFYALVIVARQIGLGVAAADGEADADPAEADPEESDSESDPATESSTSGESAA
ncbi:MAG: DUF4013 domain-containing protein [Halococcoides sp.]